MLFNAIVQLDSYFILYNNLIIFVFFLLHCGSCSIIKLSFVILFFLVLIAIMDRINQNEIINIAFITHSLQIPLSLN